MVLSLLLSLRVLGLMLNCKYLLMYENFWKTNSNDSLVLYAVLIAGAAGVAYIIREAFFADTKKSKKVMYMRFVIRDG